MDTYYPNYDEVAKLTWVANDLEYENLEISKKLFTMESSGKPTPKLFEVTALVSGLPFSSELLFKIKKIQKELSEFTSHSIVYWVQQKNLAIEYAVFKWPEDEKLTIMEQQQIVDFLDSYKFYPIRIQFKGVQLNPDGCFVLKGYDITGEFLRLRKELASSIKFLPRKQSSWFHIPIGRVLCPVGTDRFKNLREYIENSEKSVEHHETLDNIKLVDERQWYMEQRNILKEVGVT